MASTFFGFLCRGAQLTGGFLALALDRIFEICISCSLNLITGRLPAMLQFHGQFPSRLLSRVMPSMSHGRPPPGKSKVLLLKQVAVG